MSILNKRNALLGWVVWRVGKLAAKRKARQVVKSKPRSRKKAIVPAVAATGGALWFWRRRRGNDEAGT